MNDLVKPFQNLEGAPREVIQNFIAQVEEHARINGVPVEIPIEHYFSKDVYAREMKLKAGDFIVGKIHKFENLNILSEGEVAVCSIDGILRVKAPHTFVGSPGAKRVIYAITNVTWTTIHGTKERDVELIEKEVIAESYEALESLAPGLEDETKNLETKLGV